MVKVLPLLEKYGWLIFLGLVTLILFVVAYTKYGPDPLENSSTGSGIFFAGLVTLVGFLYALWDHIFPHKSTIQE